MEPLLHIHQVSHGDMRRPRLRDIDLRMQRGERLALLGVNGAGKTTLLQIVAGMLAPTRGEVLFDGQPLHAADSRARGRIGFLPQQVACYPELSVAENLDWVARLHGLPAPRRARAIDEALSRVGLGDVAVRLAGQLSAGMLQRLGLAQALLGGPELLVLDEPTASLDPLQTEQIRELLASLAGDTAILLATHLLDDVHRLCQRVAVLKDGRLEADHPVDDEVDLLLHFHNGSVDRPEVPA
jgi:ABC-2 type transport system ATP-binding protein